jgi:hypothetical protein
MIDFPSDNFDPAKLRIDNGFVFNRSGLHGRWSVEVHESREAIARGAKPLQVCEFLNGITDVGMNDLLDAWRDGVGTVTGGWFAGLIDNAGYTGVDPSDTSGGIGTTNGWSEATQYDESVRQTLSFGAAASRTISDSVSFTMNATKTIQGIFVISVSTKGGTTGILFSTALFASPPALTSGNVLTANYSLSD